jgi:hypothetical protein
MFKINQFTIKIIFAGMIFFLVLRLIGFKFITEFIKGISDEVLAAIITGLFTLIGVMLTIILKSNKEKNQFKVTLLNEEAKRRVRALDVAIIINQEIRNELRYLKAFVYTGEKENIEITVDNIYRLSRKYDKMYSNHLFSVGKTERYLLHEQMHLFDGVYSQVSEKLSVNEALELLDKKREVLKVYLEKFIEIRTRVIEKSMDDAYS